MDLPLDPSSAPSSNYRSKSFSKNLWQLAGAAGVVLLLVVVMYPGTLANPALTTQNSTQTTSNLLTSRQQDVCNSADDELVAGVPSGQNHDPAVDLLEGMYCSRADLVDSIGSTSFPATGLMAYACESTRGTVTDQDASDTLQQYGSLYCTGATQSLNSEISDLKSSLTALNGNVKYSKTMDAISTNLAQAQSLISSEKPYAAYKEFNAASQALANVQV